MATQGPTFSISGSRAVFVSPEITVATDLSLGTQSARASLRLRYAGMFLEDYAESGSIAAELVYEGDRS